MLDVSIGLCLYTCVQKACIFTLPFDDILSMFTQRRVTCTMVIFSGDVLLLKCCGVYRALYAIMQERTLRGGG